MGTSSDWPSTHETLIEQLQAEPGGPAWDLFAEVYVPLIYRFCRRRGLQDADAQDVTNSVFIAVRKGLPRLAYDPAVGKFRGWLGTVTRNELMRDQRRSKRAGQPTEFVAAGWADMEENDAGWIVAFNSHVCQAALERIRPDFEALTWRAFEQVWMQDQTPADVAARFEKSRAWVHQVKFRVLQRLEKEVRFLAADIPAFAKDCAG
ncbi:MAG: sigma-70 family RNA polymerase sigma factor [Planctomycetaceae bacterium]|nr:sigma-70 family RNA polymerase sigma factor [Planctomycetaceae bacterium]